MTTVKQVIELLQKLPPDAQIHYGQEAYGGHGYYALGLWTGGCGRHFMFVNAELHSRMKRVEYVSDALARLGDKK